MTTDGSGPASVIATSPTNSRAFVSPSWSPSGDELADDQHRVGPSGIQMNLQFMKPDGTGVRTLTPGGNPRPLLDRDRMDGRRRGTPGDWRRQLETDPAHSNVRRPRGAGDQRRPRLFGSLVFPGVRRHCDRADHAARVDLDRAGGSSGTGPGGAKPARRARRRCGPVVAERLRARVQPDGEQPLDAMDDAGGWHRSAPTGAGIPAIANNPRADRAGRAVVFEGIREVGALPEVYRLTFPDGRVTQVTRENGAMAGSSPTGARCTSGGPRNHKRRSCGRLRTVVPRRGSSKRRDPRLFAVA